MIEGTAGGGRARVACGCCGRVNGEPPCQRRAAVSAGADDELELDEPPQPAATPRASAASAAGIAFFHPMFEPILVVRGFIPAPRLPGILRAASNR